MTGNGKIINVVCGNSDLVLTINRKVKHCILKDYLEKTVVKREETEKITLLKTFTVIYKCDCQEECIKRIR